MMTWVPGWSKNKRTLTICVGIKGIDGYVELPWDNNEIKGAHYAAAKKVAMDRGFDDVIETGVMKRGNGFIFEPVVLGRDKE